MDEEIVLPETLNGSEAEIVEAHLRMQVFDFSLQNMLTKRECFAAVAMQGLLAAETSEMRTYSYADTASMAVRMADALLLALETTKP